MAFCAFMVAAWTSPYWQKPINDVISHDTLHIQQGTPQVPWVLIDVLHAQYGECSRSPEVSIR